MIYSDMLFFIVLHLLQQPKFFYSEQKIDSLIVVNDNILYIQDVYEVHLPLAELVQYNNIYITLL